MCTIPNCVAWAAILALAALIAGCAPETPGPVTTAPAEQTVRIRHEPLAEPFPPEGEIGNVWAVEECGWASQQALEKGLASRLPKLELDGVPLGEALARLAGTGRFNLHVRWEALKRAEIDPKTPVRLKLADVTVEQALWTVLQDVGGVNPLDFEVRSGVVTVSTKDDLSQQTVTRVYDARDIIVGLRGALSAQTRTIPQSGIFGADTSVVEEFPMTRAELVDSLLETIRRSIEPQTWRGGETPGMFGSLSELGGKLIMTHRPSTHRKVHRLLEALRGRTDRVPASGAPRSETPPKARPAGTAK